MRNLCKLVAVGLFVLVMAGCQAGISGFPVVVNSINADSDILKLNITGPVDESVVRSSHVTVSGNTEPEAAVVINGLSIDLEKGHFSVTVELDPGPNLINILAKNPAGKQISKYVTVVYIP
jgi:hypothetical protein